jgi:hypothetical protein
MQQTPEKPARTPKPALFLWLMIFYLLLVHVWMLPREAGAFDKMFIEHPDAMGSATAPLMRLEHALFGDWLAGYRIVNLLLLYGCMVATFYLTRYALRGPWWLGSLTAVLLMAHPAKSDALIHPAGTKHLLGALLALTALAFYGANTDCPKKWKYATAWALAVLAVLFFRANRWLPVVILLLELVALPSRLRSPMRGIPFLMILPAWLLLQYIGAWRDAPFLSAVLDMPSNWFFPPALSGPVLAWVPLFLSVWPIGLTPGVVTYWHMAVWTPGIVLFLLFLYWRMRRGGQEAGVFAFGVLSAIILRLVYWEDPVALQTLSNGGALIVPLSLLFVAFAALCLRIMRHPAWRQPVVFITALLCLTLFLLQIKMYMDPMYYP